ncbi:hypothetical protein CONLIGDRAFT_587014 [Coniochaeta ligniaria NRRL 30616]|uniref:Protein kinase domain-containing protein n=1 Tax=Coniochaeta ligniaria NRRL 30616 TaxID=1408157 RepID=A0A1J7INL1_9PEZI|nr:hypothetical protein CONLIGDRAFT_587014 [Coniochaeta ligniaria NRRL 30616]
MSSTIPFVSQEPNVGDPPLGWENFLHPKLRRFPGSSEFELELYLGGGVDGFVFKAKVDEQHTVAVKIFYHDRQPEPVDGVSFYWPLERESINGALLLMIHASLQRAASTGRPIYLLPGPQTKKEAIRNLWAFSNEGHEQCEPPPQYFQPFTPDVQINRCLGWTELGGRSIIRALNRARVLKDMDSDKTYLAIVYEFVPKEKLQVDTILSQLDFFYATGFHHVPFNPSNWLGKGVLVDFSDIIWPFAHPYEWNERQYAKGHKLDHASVRGFERRALL